MAKDRVYCYDGGVEGRDEFFDEAVDPEILLRVPAKAEFGDSGAAGEESADGRGVHQRIHFSVSHPPHAFQHGWSGKGVKCGMFGVSLRNLLGETRFEFLERSDMEVEFRMEEEFVDDGQQDVGLTALAVAHHEDSLALGHDERDDVRGSRDSASGENEKKKEKAKDRDK